MGGYHDKGCGKEKRCEVGKHLHEAKACQPMSCHLPNSQPYDIKHSVGCYHVQYAHVAEGYDDAQLYGYLQNVEPHVDI